MPTYFYFSLNSHLKLFLQLSRHRGKEQWRSGKCDTDIYESVLCKRQLKGIVSGLIKFVFYILFSVPDRCR